MAQPRLHTERLVLVPLAEEHLPFEIELDSEPEVMRYITGRALSLSKSSRRTGGGSPPPTRCPRTEGSGPFRWKRPAAARCRVYLTISPADAEITGAGLEWTVAMISELSMPCG